MCWVRLTLEDPQHHDLVMHVDVLIDDEFRVQGKVPYAGWLGKVRSNECYPFLLRANSRGVYCLDYGESPDDKFTDESERTEVFRLPGLRLRKGEKVSYLNEREDEDLPKNITFLLREAHDLIQGPSIFE